MANSTPGNLPRIGSLILVPAVISLAITILRLVGELEHWSSALFNRSPGGAGALVGIVWLPIIFGPYFAIRLAKAGSGWSSGGKAWGMLGLGFVILVAGGFTVAKGLGNPGFLAILGFVLLLVAALLPIAGWGSLGKTMLAYAFAARIPVLIVMFFAMSANNGAGWGTHYDVVTPGFPATSFASKFFYLAFMPQMTLWIAWTVIVGTLCGLIAAAIGGRGKPAVSAT